MLIGRAFQIAYVATNLDRACKMMAERYGVRRFLRQDEVRLQIDPGGEMILNLANAWLGSTWLEIIEPVGGAVAIYRDWLAGGQEDGGAQVRDPSRSDASMRCIGRGGVKD
jgi:hypothetical protein